MSIDYDASSTPSLVLSWIFCIPVLLGFIQAVIFAFQKHEGIPWLYSAWVGACFFVLSPLRYVALLIVLAVSYPFQSVPAFFSIIEFWRWTPAVISFGILLFIGIYAPLGCVLWVVGSGARVSPVRCLISAVIAPIAAFAGSFLFFMVFPFAGMTAHLLDADAIIRATNGPAQIVFRLEGAGMVALPPYFKETPRSYTDVIRSHVALMYLSHSEHDNFLKMAYPDLYEKFHEIVIKL